MIHLNIIFPFTPGSTKWFFPSGFPLKPCIRLSTFPYVLHAPPISFSSISSPEQYWTRSTDHKLLIMYFYPLPCYLGYRYAIMTASLNNSHIQFAVSVEACTSNNRVHLRERRHKLTFLKINTSGMCFRFYTNFVIISKQWILYTRLTTSPTSLSSNTTNIHFPKLWHLSHNDFILNNKKEGRGGNKGYRKGKWHRARGS
jgi:hypothetical protein